MLFVDGGGVKETTIFGPVAESANESNEIKLRHLSNSHTL